MKKRLFLFLFLLMFSCQTNQEISSSSSETSSFVSESISSSIIEESSFISEDGNENYAILEKNKNSYKLLIDNQEIEYKANIIVDGEEFITDKHLYLQELSDSINFLVINGGTLIIKETTIVKKGDTAKEDENTLRYGKNASILVIGQDSKVQIEDVAINVFASYSSAIHCMYGGVAEIKSCDILVISKASHAYSTYKNGMVFSESILTLVDSPLVVAFCLYEGSGLISILGNNNYIEVHGSTSYVGVVKSGALILKNIYGYSENSVLFNVSEGASITLDNALITES